MNKKLKRMLGAVLAFSALLCTMLVLNAVSAFAAVDTSGIDSSTTTVWDFLGATATSLTEISGSGSTTDTAKYWSSGAGNVLSVEYSSENTGIKIADSTNKAAKFNAVTSISGKAHLEIPAQAGDTIYVYAFANKGYDEGYEYNACITFCTTSTYSADNYSAIYVPENGALGGAIGEVSYTVPSDFEGDTIYIVAGKATTDAQNSCVAAVARVRAASTTSTTPAFTLTKDSDTQYSAVISNVSSDNEISKIAVVDSSSNEVAEITHIKVDSLTEPTEFGFVVKFTDSDDVETSYSTDDLSGFKIVMTYGGDSETYEVSLSDAETA